MRKGEPWLAIFWGAVGYAILDKSVSRPKKLRENDNDTVHRRELKTRSRFQSNLPTGAASVVSLLAFGMHTGLACAVLGKLFRDSTDEILGLFFSSNFFFKVDFFFSCTENKIFCTNFNF